MCRMRINDFMI